MSKQKPNDQKPKHARRADTEESGEKEKCVDADAKAVESIEATDDVGTLSNELAETKNQVLRAHAELDNFRKRSAREMKEERRYANISLMRDLLPVMDNVNRAIEAAEKADDAESLVEGFKMVGKLLYDVLAKHYCVEIEAIHKQFDPHFHEAISQQPSDEYPANVITHVHQVGFKLHDRVVRPSKVVVSSGKPKER